MKMNKYGPTKTLFNRKHRMFLVATFIFVMAVFLLRNDARAETGIEKIRIEWVYDEADKEAAEALIPEKMVLRVYRNESSYRTVTLYKARNWSMEVNPSAYPVSSGYSRYTYTLKDNQNTVAPAFTAECSVDDSVATMTYTFHDTQDWTAKIIFSMDDDNYYGLQPESINTKDCVLSCEDFFSVEADSIEKSDINTWTANFKDIPTYYKDADGKYTIITSPVLTVKGIPENYYEQSYNYAYKDTRSINYQISFKCYQVTFIGNVCAQAGNNTMTGFYPAEKSMGFDPTSTLILMNGDNEAKCREAKFSIEEGFFIRSWILPLNDENGQAIDYSKLHVVYTPDQNSAGFDKRLSQEVKVMDEGNSRLYHVRTILPSVAYPYYFNFTWDDDNNSMGYRPERFTLYLTKDGERVKEVAPISVSADDFGKNVNLDAFAGLPERNADGTYARYGLEVADIPAGYEAVVSQSPVFEEETGYAWADSTGRTLTETVRLHYKTQTMSAEVKWETDGSRTEQEVRPGDVVLTVYSSKDGGTTWEQEKYNSKVIVSAGNNWQAQWKVPLMDEEGNRLLYRAEQNPLDMYQTVTDIESPENVVEGAVTSLMFTNKYNTAWDYMVTLQWDEEDQNRKYNDEVVTAESASIKKIALLSIATNQAYEAGELSFRLPFVLYSYRGSGIPNTRCSLPMAPETNPNYAFNYTIDKHNSSNPNDWELVLTNWRNVDPGYNLACSVQYTVHPGQVTDCDTGILRAVGTGRSTVQTETITHTSNEITMRLDTGLSFIDDTRYRMKFSENIYYDDNGEYDFTKYRYVRYQIMFPDNKTYMYYNQSFHVELTDVPGDEGEVVKVLQPYGQYTMQWDEQAGVWRTKTISSTGYDVTSTKIRCDRFGWFVDVRYPIKDEEQNNQYVYHNAGTLRFVADDVHDGDKGKDDRNDVWEIPLSATAVWKEYVFKYTGNIFYGSKLVQIFEQYSSDLTILANGGKSTSYFEARFSVYGYDYANGYTFDMYDDAMYAKLPGDDGSYRLLTSEDYYISDDVTYRNSRCRNTVQIQSSDVDRTNGKTIGGYVPAEPFIVWGRKDEGEWEKIAELIMTSDDTTFNVPVSGEKNYTAVRITTPEGLQGHFHVIIKFYMTLKGTSPYWKELNDAGTEQVDICNFAGFELYKQDENGRKIWANSQNYISNTAVKSAGLDKKDKARLGKYVYRANNEQSIYAVESSSWIKKENVAETLDYESGRAKVRFRIEAGEKLNTDTLGTDVYSEWSADEGVFYDLLPLGYTLDADKAIEVTGARANYDDGTFRSAELIKTEIINNFRNSGRQMVIFHIRASEEGKNYLIWDQAKHTYGAAYTGFSVYFHTSISYEDIALYGAGNNVAVYQRADGRAIADGYKDNGCGDTANDVYPKAEDGTYLLANLSGDMTTKNSLYAYAAVNPVPLPTVQTGIRKTVRAEKGSYVLEDAVNVGGEYSYRVIAETSPEGYTSNIVLYDILETADNNTGWKGVFERVDTSAATLRGSDVKVYYSSDTLTYSDTDELALDSGHWKELTEDTPKEKVKALAFDMRKTPNGDDFIMDKQVYLYVEIYMKAPEELQNTVYAYNKPAYICTYRPRNSTAEYTTITEGNVVTLSLHQVQEINFTKMYEDDGDGETKLFPLPGVNFYLHKFENEEEAALMMTAGGNPYKRQKSREDGTVTFKGLATGVYALQEDTPAGVVPVDCYWLYTVNAEKGSISGPVLAGDSPTDMYNDNGTWVLINKRITGNISVKKVFEDGKDKLPRPEKLTFELYRGSTLYRTETVEVGEDHSHTYENLFSNLPVGEPNGAMYEYTVKEKAVPMYETSPAEGVTVKLEGDQTVQITNSRMGVIAVEKQMLHSSSTAAFTVHVAFEDANGMTTLAETDITALRYPKNSKVYTTETLETDEQGVASFSIHGGERVILIDIPLGTVYRVSEESGNYICNIDHPTGVAASVKKTVFITNEPQPVELMIPIRKNVTGDPAPRTEFTFAIDPLDYDIAPKGGGILIYDPMPQNTSLSIYGSGTGSFGPIRFTNEGIYHYEVWEEKGSTRGFKYDTEKKKITVTVKDEDGKLTARWEPEGSTDSEVIFTNSYSMPLDYCFSFTIKWNGEAKDSVSWTLYDGNGDVVHKLFNKRVISATEWYYEAWFAKSADDYYLLEDVPEGYIAQYRNTGADGDADGSCRNGGTIINTPIPKTGEGENPARMILYLMLGACGVLILYRKRNKKTA